MSFSYEQLHKPGITHAAEKLCKAVRLGASERHRRELKWITVSKLTRMYKERRDLVKSYEAFFSANFVKGKSRSEEEREEMYWVFNDFQATVDLLDTDPNLHRFPVYLIAKSQRHARKVDDNTQRAMSQYCEVMKRAEDTLKSSASQRRSFLHGALTTKMDDTHSDFLENMCQMRRWATKRNARLEEEN
jgi:hypothetical protein